MQKDNQSGSFALYEIDAFIPFDLVSHQGFDKLFGLVFDLNAMESLRIPLNLSDCVDLQRYCKASVSAGNLAKWG